MHRLTSLTFAFLLVSPSHCLFTCAPELDSSTQNSTVQALVYGIPTLEYALFANGLANISVVLHNVDTLYSEAILDLSQGDVIATMPVLEEECFYVWPFYDLYSDNFCNIGTLTNSTAGKYLITYRPSNPGCEAGSGDYAGTIYSPTVYGMALLHIEVRNTSDMGHVVSSIQPKFMLDAGPPAFSPRAPALTAALINAKITTSSLPLRIMQLTARLATYNSPEVAGDVVVHLDLGYNASQLVLARVATSTTDFISLGNNWTSLTPALCGDFKSNYDVRAYIAMKVYLQLQATEAIYPSYLSSESLYSNQSHILKFLGKPQVKGFWSLTMYDSERFLVPNSLNHYSLNNRGNLTYPDGKLVYGADTPSDSTESFYMLLQSTDTPPPAEWELNWLPIPAGDEEFQFYLRWYGPTELLCDGPMFIRSSPLPSSN
ncbi:hypothetical protein B0H14DRAFT_3449430 [Mycena olivaceomarginata]|nr:hypothetical protein B0H14DRAFT_3449430 [Mycena olivaceomarginata]